ncbi:hypothetical protein HFO38_19370 [Rhizobium leguminosarum]|uniref:hypothetical protein n=1 Tax=Rhizobium leguminosarum TaxID=384 RepID=UPI001C9767A1|nr:hypothetical protein [Rhizobium leguminosarum]MBY5704848.1 hypothetical protein [Rhizobium leguminosarum]
MPAGYTSVGGASAGGSFSLGRSKIKRFDNPSLQSARRLPYYFLLRTLIASRIATSKKREQVMKKAITPIMFCDNTEFYCNHPYARASILPEDPSPTPAGPQLCFFWLVATNATAVVAASA